MTTTPTEGATTEQFVSITCSTPDEAILYLRFAKGDLQQAIESYFGYDGGDCETSNVLPPPQRHFSSPPPLGFLSPPAPRKAPGDLDHEHNGDGSNAKRSQTPTRALPAVYTPSGVVAEPVKGPTYDADLALATSLQREYDAQASDYRLGCGSQHLSGTKPQRSVPDHWIRNPNWAGLGPNFNTSLGGLTSEPFPPRGTRSQAPDEILSTLTWEEAQEVGMKEERWILINIQDPAIAKCQILNREIWNDIKVLDLVREKFIFLQCRKDEYRAREYIAYHFPVSTKLQGAYPHIAIVDPRTGEQLKLWSGYVPKIQDFLAEIRDFLDLHSLNPRAKKPVGWRKGSNAIREEPMREVVEAEAEADQPWYIQSVEQPQSFFDDLYGASDLEESPYGQNPNTPTISASPPPPPNSSSRFDQSSSSSSSSLKTEALNPSYQSSSSHTRFPSNSTLINFCRLSGQSTRHKFSLSDPVRAMYEWLEESREDGEGEGEGEAGKKKKKRQSRRLFLSFEGRDLSEALNERIADIPGLVGNVGNDGGEAVANVLVDNLLYHEGVPRREKN